MTGPLPVLAGLSAVVCFSGSAHAVAATPAPPIQRPRLILALSVDQMRFDYLTRFEPLFKGGLRMLLDRGAVLTNARYNHANTETGPGHSVLLTGRLGSHSGIVGNTWYDRVSRKLVNVVEDPVHSPLGGAGRGASPRNLVGFTLGDMLKKDSPGSRVVGVSLKDRSAILMTGHRADAAYWYETTGGNFITSTYYASAPPRWLVAFNERRLPDRRFGKPWTRLLDDETVYRKYAGEDAVAGEWDNKDIVFPHLLRGKPPEFEFYDDVRRTPYADEMVLEFALEAMKAHALGVDAATDLLAIGFSASDVIGHTYGPDSQELMDQMLRLDMTLGKLFAEVDRRVGLGRTIVVLSSDHGVTPLVEVERSRGIDARRAKPELLRSAVMAAVKKHFPKCERLIAFFDPPDFFIDPDAISCTGLELARVESVLQDALMETGIVDRVYTPRELLGDPPKGDPLFPLHRNSFFGPRSPDLIVRLKPHVYLATREGGAGHGTPYEDDRHVPIVFMGARVKAGRYTEPCGPEQIAPTLGALIQLDYPLQDAARVLSEVIGP